MNLKKTFYILLILFLSAASVYAQKESLNKDAHKYKLFSSVGVLAGAELSTLSGDSPKDVSYGVKPGFLGGISVEFNVTDDIKILLQPMYSIRNTKLLFDTGEKDPVDSMVTKFEYIRVPVSAKILAFNDVTYFLSGLDFGYLLSAKLNDKEKINPERDVMSIMNRFDIAALFGIGVNFKIASNFLYLELRYQQSLLNMSNTGGTPNTAYLPTRFRLGGLQLLTGFNFSL